MTEGTEKPFARSYWVIPGKLLAGCYPDTQNTDEAEQKLRALLNSGIRFIVNLMEVDEMDHGGSDFVPYEETFASLAQDLSISVACARHPIRDLSVPTNAGMIRILDEIDEAIYGGLPVYVHCWGGVGRTGTVVGCYLVRHQIATQSEVLDKIKHLRRNDPTASRYSPETELQTQMVVSWEPGE